MKKIFTTLFMVVIMTASISVADEVVRGQWHIDVPSDIWFDVGDSTLFLFSGCGDFGDNEDVITIWRFAPNLFTTGDQITIRVTAPADRCYRLEIWGFSVDISSGTIWRPMDRIPLTGPQKIITTCTNSKNGVMIRFSIPVVPDYFGKKYNICITEIKLNGRPIDGLVRDPGIPVTVAESPLQQPTAFALCQNYPNPFNASTTIRFSLPQAGEAQLAIYNINGQLVRELIAGIYPAGTHEAIWDGRDSFGQSVPSGIYFYKITTADHVAVKKLNLIK